MKVADVTIERIAAGGDGIARDSGIVIFVPRTAPGDRVRISLDVRKRFGRGNVQELLYPSPDRVDPPCDHYRVDRCGGCQIQHMSYGAQLAAKQGLIRDAITRIGKRDGALPEIEGSDKAWRYRHKLTLAIRRDQHGEWVIGLHPYDDPVGVFQLSDCPITDERVMAVWREIMDARRYFPRTDELRASVRIHELGASIVMEGGDAWREKDAFFAAVPSATALWWKPSHHPRTLVASRGDAVDGASFAQVNASVGAALHSYVRERARSHNPRTLIDAYAGSGATAVPLARDGIRVTAIELDHDASAQCAADLPAGSQAIEARVEDVLKRALPADVILLNPPRAGVHEDVSALLETTKRAPRAIIYVSCDPATLARDLSRMPRYKIAAVKAFDMFPQTAHVETVCELVPEAA